MIEAEQAAAQPAKKGAAIRQPTKEEIAMRAHQLFVERGGEPGHDVEDWLRAESELSHNGQN